MEAIEAVAGACAVRVTMITRTLAVRDADDLARGGAPEEAQRELDVLAREVGALAEICRRACARE